MWTAGIGIGALWVISRALMVCEWWLRCQFISSDVAYYFAQMGNPNASALVEYPTPILWLMRLLHLLSFGNYNLFLDMVIILMVMLDALVAACLFWRASPAAAAYWVVFLALLGPILWFRIDLIPATCVTLALLTLWQEPRISGVLLAVGAATKLWPALLILPVIGRSKAARQRLAGFAAAGAIFALVSLVLNGWARSISPVTWQSERGLQIESLAATWSMILHATKPQAVIVQMSPYHAYEIFGEGALAGQAAASIMMAMAIVFTGIVAFMLAVWPIWQQRRNRGRKPLPRRGRRSYAMVLSATAIVLAMIAANKTFSPQYLIWLAGPLGLILAHARTHNEKRAAAVVAVTGCTIAGLTQLDFPLYYMGLITNPLGDIGVTAILVLRNILVAALTLMLMIWALRASWQTIHLPHRMNSKKNSHSMAKSEDHRKQCRILAGRSSATTSG